MCNLRESTGRVQVAPTEMGGRMGQAEREEKFICMRNRTRKARPKKHKEPARPGAPQLKRQTNW